jgi:hypothetical protein
MPQVRHLRRDHGVLMSTLNLPGKTSMMNGHWLGRYEGSNSGRVLVEIDAVGDHYEGQSFVYDDRPNVLTTFAKIVTKDKSHQFEKDISVSLIHPQTGYPVDWNQIKGEFTDDTRYPREAHLKCECKDDCLQIDWVTDISTNGRACLPRTCASEPSEYLSKLYSCTDFKNQVDQFEHYRYIYRGQERPWRLRTAFHRRVVLT